jgi:hypothetical protein
MVASEMIDCRKSKAWIWMGLGLIFLSRVAAVIWSQGYNVPDEHFQIVEPAWGLLSQPWYATWEWERGLRSWVAPGIIAGLLKLGSLVGIESPHSMMLFLRAFCASLSLLWSLWFYKKILPLVGEHWAWVSCLVFSLWPVTVYFSVRTMGETLAASAFFSVLLILSSSYCAWKFFIAGLLLGLCFSIRFQMALLIFALFGLFAFEKRWKELLPLAGGAALWLLGQGFLDLWTWGHFLHSPIQYILFNGIEGGAAEQFGADPWHRYLSLLNRWFSLPALFLVVVGLWGSVRWCRRSPYSKEILWSWVLLLAFVIPHNLTAHKEDRFLLPIYPLFFWLCCVGLYLMWQNGKLFSLRPVRVLALVLLLISYLHRGVRMPWQNNLEMIRIWESQAKVLKDGMRVAYYGELPSLFYMRRDLKFLDRPYHLPEIFVDRVLDLNNQGQTPDAWVLLREKERILELLARQSYKLGRELPFGVFLVP